MLIRVALAAALLGAGGAAQADETDIAYGPRAEQRLDVCSAAGAGVNRTAVLLIHGGGWRNGSRADMTRHCGAFTAHGLVAIAVDYRLAAGTPDTVWPAQIQDSQLAMRWVRANSKRLGIDPGHICAYGVSAGGHLALLLGVLDRPEPGDMASVLPLVSAKADCVVSVAGPSDLRAMARHGPLLISLLLGGPVDTPAALAEEDAGSPALRARHGDAPTLLVQGINDPIVPYAQATEMQDALRRVGVPVWLVSHPGGHMMQGVAKPQGQEIWAAIFAFLVAERLAVVPDMMGGSDGLLPQGKE